jgi:UDP-3-O-[3-hydroxymyristoyl] N-acetylglucosamine deacetylase
MKVSPAICGSGIVFKRLDVVGLDRYVYSTPWSIAKSTCCTRLANRDGVSVSVVEHLMASFRACMITNALVELDSEEVPIMDGSSSVFVQKFMEAGKVGQPNLVQTVLIKSPISVEDQFGRIDVVPSSRCRISVAVDYERINSVVGKNREYSFSPEDDLTSLMRARTFGWTEDLEMIRNKGLALGASEANTIGILGDNKIANRDGLRHPKEIVMHKCLDLLGDISILGLDIIGEIKGINTSHHLNNILAMRLADETDRHRTILERRNNYNNLVTAVR